MIFKLVGDELSDLCQRVRDAHGPGWEYVHTVSGVGPDGRMGTVDVFRDHTKDPWTDKVSIYVLDGKILDPH